MDRTTTLSGSTTGHGGNSNPKVEGAAQSVHKSVDAVADKAHRAVNSAADAAAAATEWSTGLPEQAKQMHAKISDAACASIRARPMTTVAGALVLGYLLGRLARL